MLEVESIGQRGPTDTGGTAMKTSRMHKFGRRATRGVYTSAAKANPLDRKGHS